MKKVLTILRNEMRLYFFSPMAYIIFAAFLAGSGFTFYFILIGTRDANVIRDVINFNTFLTLVIAPLITMRLIAEERKSNSFELFVTAPVNDWQIILGKYFASVLFFGIMLSSTIIYFIIISRFSSPDKGMFSWGTTGLLIVGGTFFSVGLLMSSFRKNQIEAAILTFITLLILYLLPFVSSVVPEKMANILDFIGFIKHMDSFGKGIIDSRDIIYFVSAIVFFLTLATIMIGRRKWQKKFRFTLGVILLMLLLTIINFISFRHYFIKDYTSFKIHTISESSKGYLEKLAQSDEKIRVFYFSTSNYVGANAQIIKDVKTRIYDLFVQITEMCPNIIFEDISNSNVIRISELKEKLDLSALRENDFVFFSGNKVRNVNLYEMFTVKKKPGDKISRLDTFSAEEIIINSIKDVVSEEKNTVYFLGGHAEADITDKSDNGVSYISNLISSREYLNFKKLDNLLAIKKVPEDCSLLVVADPREQISNDELNAIEDYIGQGGDALFFIDFLPQRKTGVEELLLKYGVFAPDAIVLEGDENLVWSGPIDVVTPTGEKYRARGVDKKMLLVKNFHPHQITEKMIKNFALWLQRARPIIPAPVIPQNIKFAPLISASEKSWGELDYLTGDDALFTEGHDIKGPVTLAAAVKVTVEGVSQKYARIVVIGDSDLIRNNYVKKYGTIDFPLNCIRWLLNKDYLISAPKKVDFNNVVIMTPVQDKWVMWITIIIMPVASLILGFLVWLFRIK